MSRTVPRITLAWPGGWGDQAVIASELLALGISLVRSEGVKEFVSRRSRGVRHTGVAAIRSTGSCPAGVRLQDMGPSRVAAMLSVQKILGGQSAASYYLDQVAEGREDYYAGEGEESGRWVGSGASLLEWSGEVDADDFTSLLGGAGQRKPRVDDVAGFDLTFRAPKSQRAVGDRPRARRA